MFETLKMFDRALLLKINSLHSPLMDTFMWVASQSWHSFLFVLVVAFAFYKKYTLKKAVEFTVACALVVACADISSNFVKHNVKRFRPTHNIEIKEQIHKVNNPEGGKYEGGKYGFFSAHAANTFGITTFIFLAINWIQKKYRFLLFIYPLLVCYSRMYLGVHYPSDIITGMLVGIFFGYLLYLIINTYLFKLHEKTV